MIDSQYNNPGPPDWWGSALSDPNPCNAADFTTFATHVYSPSNKYILPVVGQGAAIKLWVYDSNYGDNSGSLTVSIHAAASAP